MRGESVRNAVTSALQHAEFVLLASQTKPLLLMSIEVTGPAGPGNVKPRALLCATWSSPMLSAVPSWDTKQGALTAPWAAAAAARSAAIAAERKLVCMKWQCSWARREHCAARARRI